jgi:Ca2+-binding RTX toxin-like protein
MISMQTTSGVTVDGRDGNDMFAGGFGHDFLIGGNDTLLGGTGRDLLLGGDGRRSDWRGYANG